jgi:hypothetical protein
MGQKTSKSFSEMAARAMWPQTPDRANGPGSLDAPKLQRNPGPHRASLGW